MSSALPAEAAAAESSAQGAAASSESSSGSGAGYGSSYVNDGITQTAGIIQDVISTAMQNKYNRKEAQKQRDWQERMSSTAHQREMADLRAAGLNPILTAMGGQGSATPSGGYARSADLKKNIGEMRLQFMTGREQIENMKADRRVKDAQIKNLEQQTTTSAVQALAHSAQAARDNSQADINSLLSKKVPVDTDYQSAAAAKVRADIVDRLQQNVIGKAESDLYRGASGPIISIIDKLRKWIPGINIFKGRR